MIKGYSAVSRLGEATSIWDVDSLDQLDERGKVSSGLCWIVIPSSRIQICWNKERAPVDTYIMGLATSIRERNDYEEQASSTALASFGAIYKNFKWGFSCWKIGFIELSKSYEASITQLQKDLYESKREMTRVESNMVEALAAKNAEIEALVSSMDVVKSQAAMSQGNLASLQALREEVESVERRAEEKRAAYIATKMVAMERKVELEHGAVESSTALSRI
ncbi:hypothetical protein JHK85_004449 [Glycine max]|nr:hypothetical protein JHK85_004449 [Glycine max]KAG5080209.1 hypothetical protein JHK86_004274 [Glycine max]